MKVMHSFEVHSNESACRKKVRLGLEQVIEKNLEIVYDLGEGGVESFVGECFSAGAYWELEAANDDDVRIEEGIT